MIEFKGTVKEFLKNYPKAERKVGETYRIVTSKGSNDYQFVGSVSEKNFKAIKSDKGTAKTKTKTKTSATVTKDEKKETTSKAAFNQSETLAYSERGMQLYEMIKATKRMTSAESLAMGCVLTEYIFDVDLKFDLPKKDVKGLLNELYQKYTDAEIQKEIMWFLDNFDRVVATNRKWQKLKHGL